MDGHQHVGLTGTSLMSWSAAASKSWHAAVAMKKSRERNHDLIHKISTGKQASVHPWRGFYWVVSKRKIVILKRDFNTSGARVRINARCQSCARKKFTSQEISSVVESSCSRVATSCREFLTSASDCLWAVTCELEEWYSRKRFFVRNERDHFRYVLLNRKSTQIWHVHTVISTTCPRSAPATTPQFYEPSARSPATVHGWNVTLSMDWNYRTSAVSVQLECRGHDLWDCHVDNVLTCALQHLLMRHHLAYKHIDDSSQWHARNCGRKSLPRNSTS